MAQEEIIRELRALANRKPLGKDDLAKAIRLMIDLKKLGFTNKEISEMTDHAWSEPTVKTYTAGTLIEDATYRKDAVSLLKEMVARDLTLDDVKGFLTIESRLKVSGVSFDAISDLLLVTSASVGPKDLVAMYMGLKEAKLSFVELREILSHKRELDKHGFKSDALLKVKQVSEAYGGYEEVLDAIMAYTSLKDIESERERAASEKERFEKQAKELTATIDALEQKKTTTQATLMLYEELGSMGYDKETLQNLKRLAEKCGGIKHVMDALNAYATMDKLTAEIEDFRNQKRTEEAGLKKAVADHAHLRTVLDLCDVLLNTYNFSVPAIEDLYRTAKKYGKPIEIITAIGMYGNLKSIEKEMADLSTRKAGLQAEVDELEKQITVQRGLLAEIGVTIKNLLKPFSDGLYGSVSLLQQKFSECTDAITKKYEEYAKRYGELSEAAGRFEEELKIARVMMSIMKYPSEAKDLPLDYDIMMQKAIISHCVAKGVSLEIEPTASIAKKKPFVPTLQLIDLLEWAAKGLTTALGFTTETAVT